MDVRFLAYASGYDHNSTLAWKFMRPLTVARFRRPIGIMLLAYWILQFTGTHVPLSDDVIPPEVSDKTLHYLAYLGLAYLLALWTSTARPVSKSRYAALLVIIAVYAAADEISQPLVNRNAELDDWFADMIGTITGLATFRLTVWLLPQRWTKPSADSDANQPR